MGNDTLSAVNPMAGIFAHTLERASDFEDLRGRGHGRVRGRLRRCHGPRPRALRPPVSGCSAPRRREGARRARAHAPMRVRPGDVPASAFRACGRHPLLRARRGVRAELRLARESERLRHGARRRVGRLLCPCRRAPVPPRAHEALSPGRRLDPARGGRNA